MLGPSFQNRCLKRFSSSCGEIVVVAEECLLHLAYQEQVIVLHASSSSTLGVKVRDCAET